MYAFCLTRLPLLVIAPRSLPVVLPAAPMASGILLLLSLASSVFAAPPTYPDSYGHDDEGIQPNPRHGHWVDTWVSMPQLVEPHNLPPAPFVRLKPAHYAHVLGLLTYTERNGRRL